MLNLMGTMARQLAGSGSFTASLRMPTSEQKGALRSVQLISLEAELPVLTLHMDSDALVSMLCLRMPVQERLFFT